jgi:acetyl esterase/lipase
VFFYGGRWETGTKEDYRFVGTRLADQGYIVVIPDYRKYPQVHFPVFVQDGAKALAWVYDNIEKYQGSSARIHIVGHSAGAQIGALLTANAHYMTDLGKSRSVVIHDFTGLAGPYDFTPDEPDLQDIFGPPQNYQLMQVTTFIDGQQPPMLLLYGTTDTMVKAYNLERLQQSIQERGGYVKSIIYPNTDHIDMVVGLSWLKSENAPIVKDMTEFFRSH